MRRDECGDFSGIVSGRVHPHVFFIRGACSEVRACPLYGLSGAAPIPRMHRGVKALRACLQPENEMKFPAMTRLVAALLAIVSLLGVATVANAQSKPNILVIFG